jgi:serine-type D-Ala-D-Ala carboxypeptidase (penicillin-binding protein 5/6)
MKIFRIFLAWLGLLFLFVFFIAVRLDIYRTRSLSDDFYARPLPDYTDSKTEVLQLTAQSYLIMDVKTGTVLVGKEIYQRLHPASITKMATAISALETYPLGETIEIEHEYPIGRNMGLQEGEKITIKNLIYGLLVHSANDAAFVLAGQSRERVSKFILRMNKFVEQLGLKNTHFVNFSGEEDYNHYSTSFDLAHLARFALNNKVFEQAIRKKEMVVTDITGEIEHQLETTNELLIKYEEIKGIKTGWTPQSGECFVGLIEINDRQFITVILGSEDRFGETEQLINWLKS